MCHGFPELWYMYKHQIKHLSELGYRVVALDMIGYGQSDAPQKPSAYTYEYVSKDMKDLVPKLGASSAVFLGHDWGSPIVWMMAVSHSQVVDGVISISIPLYSPLPINDLEIIASFIPALSYQVVQY
ncbi:Bifunctional epoxide hydrolase 2 [Entomophthora muscae]|uniref:Bifunctional epoxide hydrolase 2 n=1 Tax=Entomophthora muscae TaxID=34485 RepID=A0ACC2RXU2_9FUNG|nr:Bifunctional epoxide hydrolase 2 [Entomophthora muscae]